MPQPKVSVLKNIIAPKKGKIFVKHKKTLGAPTLAKVMKIDVVKPSRARVTNDQLNELTRKARKVVGITWVCGFALGILVGYCVASYPSYLAYEKGVRSGKNEVLNSAAP